ncbi:MAG: hypothetical protein PHI18_08590, partial [bacterium]|nr:hypothetical protein [bacterium]
LLDGAETEGQAMSNVFLQLQNASEYGMQYLRLKSDIEIHQLLLAFLVQRHEEAKIEEQRNTPTLVRLDPPSFPTRRIWPRRGLMVVISAITALVFSGFGCLVFEFIRNASRDTTHPQHRHLVRIRQAWRRSE